MIGQELIVTFVIVMELLKLDFARPVEGVEAFSTTRGEVDGRNAYSGVNLCDYVGDDALRVLDARITLALTWMTSSCRGRPTPAVWR